MRAPDYIDCPTCDGEKVVACPECNDVERVHGGDEECTEHDDDGNVPCEDCEGEGKIENSCSNCGGSGGGPDPALYCPSCHGTGAGTCPE